MLVSAVIPVFNESESLERLHQELRQVARENDLHLEIVMIDDGSTDRSWEVIEALRARDPHLAAIRFRRNFGKAAALKAGFEASQGAVVVTLDADLQDDPKEIPRFLGLLADGYDVVSGWKSVRHDPIHKTLPSKVFNSWVSLLTGVRLHDHNCGFKCYRREVLDEVDLYGELHRFIPVLAHARGFRVGELTVQHRPRTHGVSKYGFERFVKGFLDLLTVYFLTGFRQRPAHLLGTLGLIAFALGSLGMGYLAIYWVIKEFTIWGAGWAPLHERPLVLYSLGALLLGAQLVSMGFLAELITAHFARGRADYSIRTSLPARGPGAVQASAPPESSTLPSPNSSGVAWHDQGLSDPALEDPAGLHQRGSNDRS